MIKLPTLFGKRILNASKKHAQREYPKESVGAVVDNKYIALTNVHPEPEKFFEVSKDELHAKLQGQDIAAIIHSHAIDRGALLGPSEHDMQTQVLWKKPFGIQLVNKNGAGNIVWWGDGVPIQPYEGRAYISGVNDCYSIARDYYKQEFNIELRDYPRDSNWWKGAGAKDLYLAHVESEGFVKLGDKDKMKVGDVVFLCVRSNVVNHSVIYIGGDQCIHHMSDNLSCQESINRYVDRNKSFFHSIWRHKDLAA